MKTNKEHIWKLFMSTPSHSCFMLTILATVILCSKFWKT